MAEQTEAACLLQTGASYGRRLGLRSPGGALVFAGFKRGAFPLYRDDEPIYHFDLEGRWQRAFVDGVHFLKGLDATVRAVDRGREGAGMVLRRRTLEAPEVEALDEAIRQDCRDLIGGLEGGDLALLPPPAGARMI